MQTREVRARRRGEVGGQRGHLAPASVSPSPGAIATAVIAVARPLDRERAREVLEARARGVGMLAGAPASRSAGAPRRPGCGRQQHDPPAAPADQRVVGHRARDVPARRRAHAERRRASARSAARANRSPPSTTSMLDPARSRRAALDGHRRPRGASPSASASARAATRAPSTCARSEAAPPGDGRRRAPAGRARAGEHASRRPSAGRGAATGSVEPAGRARIGVGQRPVGPRRARRDRRRVRRRRRAARSTGPRRRARTAAR